MVQIVASEQLLKELRNVEGMVELIDADGNRVGVITCPPSAEEIRLAKERLAGNGPWHSAQQALDRLSEIDQP